MKIIKEKIKNMYFSYKQRIIFYFVLFILLLCLGLIFLYKTIDIEKEKVISYNEIGTLDYKVHLKDNEFYQESYLEKNKYYIASLIKNIDINLNYDFVIDTTHLSATEVTDKIVEAYTKWEGEYPSLLLYIFIQGGE